MEISKEVKKAVLNEYYDAYEAYDAALKERKSADKAEMRACEAWWMEHPNDAPVLPDEIVKRKADAKEKIRVAHIRLEKARGNT